MKHKYKYYEEKKIQLAHTKSNGSWEKRNLLDII